MLAFDYGNGYTSRDGKVSGYSANFHHNRDTDYNNALAPRPAASSSRGERQAGSCFCLRHTLLPLSAYWPSRATTNPHLRIRLRLCH